MRSFADDLVLILQEPQSGIELLIKKLTDFSALAGFKVNKQKQRCWLRIGTHRIKRLVKTSGFKIKKVKYLGITVTNMNFILVQNDYVKLWNNI